MVIKTHLRKHGRIPELSTAGLGTGSEECVSELSCAIHNFVVQGVGVILMFRYVRMVLVAVLNYVRVHRGYLPLQVS